MFDFNLKKIVFYYKNEQNVYIIYKITTLSFIILLIIYLYLHTKKFEFKNFEKLL